MFIAMFIGILWGLSGLYLPKVLSTAISSLAACMSPLAMILTGYVIGTFDIIRLLQIKKVYIASFIRLLLFPLAAFLLLNLLQVKGDIILPAVCALAMPMGLNTVVIPTANNLDVTLGASMAFISSALSLLTIPFIFMLIL